MKYFIIIILFFLSSCSSIKNHVVSSHKDKLNDYFKSRLEIDNGYLVAMYDLTQQGKSNFIFANDYGQIINNANHFESYINKVNNKTISAESINKVALHKVEQLRNLILQLNKNYNFLSNFEQKTVRNNNLHQAGKYFKELVYLHKLSHRLPILPPLPNAQITSNFGMRKKSRTKRKFHNGIDIQSAHHALIYSPANGIVKMVKKNKGYGNMVDILHNHHIVTRFAHLNDILVNLNQIIKRGEIIGTQGRTGNARGEHLHYEILYYNKPVNPLIFFGHSFK